MEKIKKNAFLIFSFSLILLMSSCKSSVTRRAEKVVKEWQGKEVIFPKSSVFTKFGKDTISISNHAKYKVLVYVDSTGCTECKLQLSHWQNVISGIDSISENEVEYLFYINPKNRKELHYLLKRNSFTIPICVDLSDSLNKLNKFPSELMFQTFLLDENNKVLLIGSPIRSDAVKKLYYNKIQNNINIKKESL